MNKIVKFRGHQNKGRAAGFTLVELLVVISILVVLAGLSVAGVSKALDAAYSVKEASAGKALIASYLTAATDNNGFLLPGYDRSAPAGQLPDGTSISGPTIQRYPYRLAPYFNYDIKGTLLTSDNAARITVKDTYLVSAYPSFGINYIFVGGDVSAAGNVANRGECLQTTGRGKGSPIIVFATAGGAAGVAGTGDATIQGYCKLEPPINPNGSWSKESWTPESLAENYGQVDARHGGKAICVFSDGSVRKLNIDELRDMRLWSFRAAEKDDPDYRIGSGS